MPPAARPNNSLSTLVKARLFSQNLSRQVKLSIMAPAATPSSPEWSVMVLFDGQDFPAVRIPRALAEFDRPDSGHPLLVVGIHANEDRIYEYGTAGQPDYAYRGNKAANTTHFVIDELIPYLREKFPVSPDRSHWCIGGFSLGGLMALDIAWHHAEFFARVGVFSGSFWWRQRALDDGYAESDRIMHQRIRNTTGRPALGFWFQTGTRDEEDDRDNDGIIDSIADTLDLIAELERKGYAWGKDIVYREVVAGEHNPQTWSEVFPEFLKWSQP